MKEFIKTHRVLFLLLGIYAACAGAATLKTWSSGESISSADLNNNFSIVNSRSLAAKSAAAAAAATATTGSAAVKAYGQIGYGTLCTVAGACTVANGYNVTSVTRGATAGDYTIVFNAVHTRPLNVLVSTNTADRTCYAVFSGSVPGSDNFMAIQCRTVAAAPANADVAVTFMLLEP